MANISPERTARITSHGALRLSADLIRAEILDYLFVKVVNRTVHVRTAPGQGFEQRKVYVSNKQASTSPMVNIGRMLRRGGIDFESAKGEYEVRGDANEYRIFIPKRREHGKDSRKTCVVERG